MGKDNISYKETRNLCNEINNGNIDKSIEIIDKYNNVNKTTYPSFLSRLFLTLDTTSITTPLIQTVELGNIEVIEALLKKGADPNCSKGCGFTAIEKLYNEKYLNNFEIAELLIRYGTVVLTSLGNNPIEDINVGDEVWSYDEETGNKTLKKVVQLFKNTTKKLLHLLFEFEIGNTEEIVCTEGHPFYVNNLGWITADKLLANDKILMYNNDEATLVNKEV